MPLPVTRNDRDYATDSAQWILLLRGYKELIEIDTHGAAPHVFKRRWEAYRVLFPLEFMDGMFDPKDFAKRTTTPINPPVLTVLSPSPPPQPRTVGERSAAILPQPFAWIPIPAGQVTIEDTAIQVPTFAIAKYPLTNAQYKPFIDAGGYKERRWWTDAGWDARAKGWEWQTNNYVETGKAWVQPRYWGDSQWNGAEQPVVGVSWYEAVAYCRWLSEHTGDSILLPSEAQWQRAAQGDDGREYPWGNDWQDGKLCNNSVDSNNSSKTTPVRRYEGKGDSPFGVVDMAGNVWEWCGTAYATGSENLDGTDVRVLRGGSWNGNDADRFRCAFRDWLYPHYWYGSGGFRLALSV
jgi:formylglycine-generating enzyme required for sulfatase activity